MNCNSMLAGAAGKAVALAMAGLWCAALPAQEPGPTFKVQAVRGAVTLATPGAAAAPVETGMAVPVGATLKTEHGSYMDLALGEACGTLRLTENTILRIDSAEASGTLAVKALHLTLERGIAVGFGNHAQRPSQYQIKIPAGLLASAASQFRVDARGYVVVLDGDAILAHLDTAGNITSDTLRAPPAVYYAPGFGIQPAPPALVHEVLRQATVKLEVPEQRKVKKPGSNAPDASGLEPTFEWPALRPQDRPKRRI